MIGTESQSKEKVIGEEWKQHPLSIAGKVELVPLSWVLKYSGQDVAETTFLSNGEEVTMHGLKKDILKKGLQVPLIMRIGLKDKNFRLEAGNHRVRVLHEINAEEVPVTVQVRDLCGPDVDETMNTGTHNFTVDGELLDIEDAEGYVRPSEVFKSLSSIK